MHISAKIMFALTVVSGLIGVVLMVIGIGELEDADGFHLEDVTSGQLELNDEDGKGEIGFMFYIEGEYVDADADGEWDDCQAFFFKHRINVTGPDGKDSDNKFWEVCKTDDETDKDENGKQMQNYPGMIYVGVACHTVPDWSWVECADGEYEIVVSTNDNSTVTPVSVVYFDNMLGDAIGGILGAAAGGGCLCCAGVFLLIGIILVFTVKGDKQQAVMSPYAASDASSPLAGEQPSTPDIHQREF